tara:strand:- start:967 stop:1275 length:309 start_codon:yes stop_codon:yes gene_type:complete
MKKINLFILILLLLTSCAGLKEAGKVLRNEKTTSTDEFLVKKKEPLIMPPNLDEVPEPLSVKRKKQNEDDNIKKILKMPRSVNNKKKSNSSTEDSIIDKIRK